MSRGRGGEGARGRCRRECRERVPGARAPGEEERRTSGGEEEKEERRRGGDGRRTGRGGGQEDAVAQGD